MYLCLSASQSNTLFDYIDNLEGEQQFSRNTLSLAPEPYNKLCHWSNTLDSGHGASSLRSA